MDETAARKLIEEHGIRWVRLEAVDIDGVVRGKRVTSERLLADLPGSPLADIHFSFSMADEYVLGAVGPWLEGIISDVLLVPDLSTFRPVPWEPGVAAVWCDWASMSGRPVAVAPRTVLADQAERLAALGFEARAAVEYEVLLLRETPETAAEKGWRNLRRVFPTLGTNDSLRSAELNDVLGDAVDEIRSCGVPIEEVKAEASESQVEINISPAPVVEACDMAARLKLSLKELLRKRGILACFLARPPGAHFGSSGHVHVSLWRDGVPSFLDAGRDDRMSDVMRHAVGGLLATMKPLVPLFCPTVNSGRRLVDLAAAPVAVCWGHENKSVAVRAITRSASAARLEHRLAGADSNPYLVVSAILAGIRHGIEDEIEPPPAKTFFAWTPMDPDLDLLPKTLRAACDQMDASELPGKLFDPTFVSHFLRTRRWELEKLDEAVTDWELARYTERV